MPYLCNLPPGQLSLLPSVEWEMSNINALLFAWEGNRRSLAICITDSYLFASVCSQGRPCE